MISSTNLHCVLMRSKSYCSERFEWARDGVIPYGHLVLSSFIAWSMCDKTNWPLVANATWKLKKYVLH